MEARGKQGGHACAQEKMLVQELEREKERPDKESGEGGDFQGDRGEAVQKVQKRQDQDRAQKKGAYRAAQAGTDHREQNEPAEQNTADRRDGPGEGSADGQIAHQTDKDPQEREGRKGEGAFCNRPAVSLKKINRWLSGFLTLCILPNPPRNATIAHRSLTE